MVGQTEEAVAVEVNNVREDGPVKVVKDITGEPKPAGLDEFT